MCCPAGARSRAVPTKAERSCFEWLGGLGTGWGECAMVWGRSDGIDQSWKRVESAEETFTIPYSSSQAFPPKSCIHTFSDADLNCPIRQAKP